MLILNEKKENIDDDYWILHSVDQQCFILMKRRKMFSQEIKRSYYKKVLLNHLLKEKVW